MIQKHKKHKVDSDLLFRFFNNATTQEEETAICDWLEESDEHKEIYGNARELHEAFLLQAPMELINGDIPETTRKKRNANRTIWLAVGNVAAVILFCVISFYLINEKLESRLSNTMATISVPAGKSMDYTLADGTVIRLNSGARLTYPLAFAKDRREVYLDGEAYFDVVHNERHPFMVKTFASDIEVLGTEFNVNTYRDVEVTLVSGAVRAERTEGSGQWTLAPGQQLAVTDAGVQVERVNVEDYICWRQGTYIFKAETLEEIGRTVKRWYGKNIVFLDRRKIFTVIDMTVRCKNHFLPNVKYTIIC